MKKVINFIAALILRVVPVLFGLFLVMTIGCTSVKITTEQRITTYTYETKKGKYRVTNTYSRNVDTLSKK